MPSTRTASRRRRARHAIATRSWPFGAGPRVCIGTAFATMEAVAILAVIVKALRLDLVGDKLPKPQMHVTLRPRTALTMRVVRR